MTGAGRGVGRAVAVAFFAREGRPVVLGDLAAPDEAAAEVRERGGEALACAADVADAGQVTAMVAAGAEAFGPAEVLVANAAIGFPDAFLDIAPERWDLVLGVNLRGAVGCAQAVLPAMLEAGAGSPRLPLLHRGSAREPRPGGALHVLEVRHNRARRAISRRSSPAPGCGSTAWRRVPWSTPFIGDQSSPEELERLAAATPLRRLAQPEDVADVIRWIAGPEARHVHGAVLDVNGGLD